MYICAGGCQDDRDQLASEAVRTHEAAVPRQFYSVDDDEKDPLPVQAAQYIKEAVFEEPRRRVVASKVPTQGVADAEDGDGAEVEVD